MAGEYRAGLYRMKLKSGYRFFRVNHSTSGNWIIREFKDGNLHNVISGSKKKLTPTKWNKLEPCQ